MAVQDVVSAPPFLLFDPSLLSEFKAHLRQAAKQKTLTVVTAVISGKRSLLNF